MAQPSLPPDLAPESRLILAWMGELGLLDRRTDTAAELRRLAAADPARAL